MARGDIVLVAALTGDPGGEEAELAIAVQSEVPESSLPVTMIVPATSRLDAELLPYTIRVEPAGATGLAHPCILLVFQLCAVERQRIIKKVGRLEPQYIARLDAELKCLLGLS
jgi:mRNA interferase MazF